MNSAALPPAPPGVLDSDGCAICPECGARVNCAGPGISNLTKRHIGSKKCRETKAIRAKNGQEKKDGSILTYFNKPKPAAVPLTVPKLAVLDSLATPSTTGAPKPNGDNMAQPLSSGADEFLDRFMDAVSKLPNDIPIATEHDRLAPFGIDPVVHDDPDIAREDLWETKINGLLKSVFGWGADEHVDEVILRGSLGLDGLVNFVRYFVVKRGVDGTLFEGKLARLLERMEEIIVFAKLPSMDESVSIVPSQIASVAPAAREIIDVDAIDCITKSFPNPNTAATLSKSLTKSCLDVKLCGGYKLIFPEGKSPHSTYPFGLHDAIVLPWTYKITAQRDMILYAPDCSGIISGEHVVCAACAKLDKNENLKRLCQRLETKLHPNTPYAYLGIEQLQNLLKHKSKQVDDLRERALNQARKALTIENSLDTSKRLIKAIASGQVNRVDRLVSICLERGMSLSAVYDAYIAAANGVYHPHGFTEEEALKSILTWRLSGDRVAEINHRANGAPSISYMRSRSNVPPLIPSVRQPTVEEVMANLDASVSGILDMLQDCVQSGEVLHANLMLDEIATEKRIRLQPKSNNMVGVCREHSHRTSMEFVNENDMVELFKCLDSGEVHYAGEATIAAVGPLCKNNRIYSARAVMVSGDCKKETGEQHAAVIQTVLDGVNMLRDKTKFRIVSIASDGEARRGSALVRLTFTKQLDASSPIFEQLKNLIFLNLYVGEDDLTCDKDFKHLVKRLRNLLLRLRGVSINGHRITPSVIMKQMAHEKHAEDHIRAVFNPDDKQDVKLAYDLLKDIWSMPRSAESSSSGFLEHREALWILGKFAYHLIFPYLCVDLTLSEQIEHLSAAAHLSLALYKIGGKEFLPTNLYVDIQLMIKNAIFCVAKAKQDNPGDRLEQLFGILRTMVGNDSNLDILQLVSRLAGTTEVSNILAMYPQWDRSPRRLKLPSLTRSSKEIPDAADHIKPGVWRGDVKVSNVSLQTSWRRGRTLAEEDCEFIIPILQGLEESGADVLTPFGVLLVTPHINDDTDDDMSIDPPTCPSDSPRTSESNPDTDLRVDIENHFAENNEKHISSWVTIEGKEISKARALAQYSKNRTQSSSTDRLRRVRAEGRFRVAKNAPATLISEPTDDENVLAISDPIGTLLFVEKNFWLCVGEVNAIHINGASATDVSFDMLSDKSVSVSYQVLGLRRATSDDDPTIKHDWRTYRMKDICFTVPGRLVQPINPTLSTTHKHIPFYLIRGSVLVALTASIFQRLTNTSLKQVPKIEPQREYPYKESDGYACFVCETDSGSGRIIDALATCQCPCCNPSVNLDLTQGQRVIHHMAGHILFDPTVINAKGVLCGLCLLPSTQCRYYLEKVKGVTRVDYKRSSGCLVKMKFSYKSANTSKDGSPCSNVPLQCPICDDKTEPAVWKYFMKQHFEEHHSSKMKGYSYLWEISDYEREQMAEIWEKRTVGVARTTRNVKRPTLKISERHRAQIVLSGPEIIIDPEMDECLEEDVVEDNSTANAESNAAEGNRLASEHESIGGIDLEDDISQILEQYTLSAEAMVTAPNDEVPVNDVAEDSNMYENMAVDSYQNKEHEPLSRSTAMNDTSIDFAAGPSSQLKSPQSELQTLDVARNCGGTRRRKTVRGVFEMNLNECLCGIVADNSAPNVIQCMNKGCETEFFHHDCVLCVGEPAPDGWTCDACYGGQGKAGKGSKRAKKSRTNN